MQKDWISKVKGKSAVELFLTLFVFVLGFGVRIYDLTDPPLDFHATRQLRSAIIARSFFYELEASKIPESETVENAVKLASLEVYEPPIMERIMSWMDVILGQEYFWVGRIFSAFFWTLGGFFIYRMGRKFASRFAVICSLLVYFFLPFSVTASRSIQPDPWMCSWIVITAFTLYRWMEKPIPIRFFFAILAGGFTILIKVFAAFFVGFMLLGCLIASFQRKNGLRIIMQGISMGALMLFPSLLYYLVLYPSRSGDFFSFWVISLSGLILTSKFYASWIALIKGLTGLILPLLAVWGVFLAEKKTLGLLLGWWTGYLMYGLVVPYQIITHEYYSLILVPLITISLIPLLDILFRKMETLHFIRRVGIYSIILLTAGYGAFVSCGSLRATSYALEPASWRKVAQAIPEDSSFIALTSDYGLRLIYYGWRAPDASWPDSKDTALFNLAGRGNYDFSSFFQAQTENKDFFLVTVANELDAQPELKTRLSALPVFFEGNGFTIYDLRKSSADDKQK